MKYLLLCQGKPAEMAHVPAAAQKKMQEAMLSFNQTLIQAGVLEAAGALAPADSALRVTQVDGKASAHPGPALEGETQIGGYYLIDVPCQEDAVQWAAKCPVAQFGALEVRQVAFSPL